jgi:preprotein translocase subunit SecB
MDLNEFAKTNGPALVMPFVREIIANITARSRNGIVLMPPINVVALTERHAETATPAEPG